MVQCYSTGDSNVSSQAPMRAHWLHLANTIELVHPSAHSSPQPKSKWIGSAAFAQLTAESAYTLQWAPLSTRIALSDGGSGPAMYIMMLWAHESPQPKRNLNRFSRVCTDDRRVSLCGLPVSPSKLFLPMLASGRHVIRGSLGPPESATQMATWSFLPFLQGSLVWQTDRATDRSTDHTTPCDAA